MYGIDVHMGLVHYLAIQAGFTPTGARLLGEWCQSVDTNIDTDPKKQWFKNVVTSPDNLGSAMAPHFPHEMSNEILSQLDALSYVPSGEESPMFRKVVRNSKSVNNLVLSNMDSLTNFGKSLHTFQDSWSHEGYKYSHGHHLMFPDLTFFNVDKHMEMARETYSRMIMFLNEKPELREAIAKPFPEDFVRNYLSTWRNQQKEILLRDNGLKEYAVPNGRNGSISYRFPDYQ